MANSAAEGRVGAWLSLFASAGTLVCCALPSLLVVVGLGATAASLVSSLPWLVVLSRHKAWVFAASGLLLLGTWYYLHRLAPRLAAPGTACPPDVSRLSRRLWILSVGLYTVGFFVAYLLAPVLEALE